MVSPQLSQQRLLLFAAVLPQVQPFCPAFVPAWAGAFMP